MKRPAFLVAGGFLILIAIGTALLSLPVAHAPGQSYDFITSLFTATSAVCLTGLIVVDTASYFSHTGQAIIMVLIQLGGLGIMTLTVLVSWLALGKVGLTSSITTTAEGRVSHLGDVKKAVLTIVGISLTMELLTAILLAARFAKGYDFAPGQAVWQGGFHAVSAFNNAGFALHSDSLIPYANDALILLPVAAAIIVGGVGFYIVAAPSRAMKSLSGWFTVWGTIILLLVGTLGARMFEDTSWLLSFFHSATTRTAGFNAIDMETIHPGYIVLTEVLMAIGGGSGGTAGGVRITTVAVLLVVVLAEVRGREEVDIRRKRIPNATVRQALAVIMMSLTLIVGATLGVTMLAPELGMEKVTFEVISAFSTTGLSLGITDALPPAAQLILIVLMFAGRIGPITVVAALASQKRSHLSYPKERPFIG
ncbi:TrkH family potassium uptake protein [Corynebacterium sp. TAE3-ERU2]|uniref:TrkH family potassium uptake protein n=1 Tax=Corynebacterium sp. TAE3-ERU2 TaxID=2849497 RepID=UPI001C45B90C|nr:potassium transporter TrkG [Corynebacterium sp. TAE3-ERU2]MBV7301559.1 TrkH family potassium uptake protein [Corynebacterium sp. TAE3-ERU2]